MSLQVVLLASCAGASALHGPHPENEVDHDVNSTWASLFRLAPVDAQALLYINYRALGAGNGVRGLLSSGESAESRRKYQGFAESEDVAESLQVSLPAESDASSQPDGAAPPSTNVNLFAVAIDPTLLERSEIAAAGDLPAFRSRRLMGRSEHALTRVSEGRVVMGPEAAVRAAIDCADGISDNATQTPWMRQAFAALSLLWPGPMRPTVEAWVQVTAPVRAALHDADWGALADLRWFALRVGTDPGLELRAVGEAENPREAEFVAAWVSERVLAMRDAPALKALGLARALEGVAVESIDNEVRVSLQLSEARWRELQQRLQEISDFVQRKRAERAPEMRDPESGGTLDGDGP